MKERYDVFGPLPIPSLEGSLYYVTFIDDFSRNLVVFLEKEIRGFQQIQRVQGSSRKPNKKEDKGIDNWQWRWIVWKIIWAVLQGVWCSMIENNSIYTPIEWSCKKDEQVANREGEEYAQWCGIRMGIMGSSC